MSKSILIVEDEAIVAADLASTRDELRFALDTLKRVGIELGIV